MKIKHSVIVLICILPGLLPGQYSYFNQGYLPPNPEIGSGESMSLLLRGDTLITYGYAPFALEYGRNINYIDADGLLLQNLNYGEALDIHLIDYSETVYQFQNGYVWSGGNGAYPITIWMDENFAELFRVEYQVLWTDTTYASFFSSNKTIGNEVVSVGRKVYDLEPEIPGTNYANLLLACHSANGNEVWFHEFFASDLGIDEDDYSGPFAFPRGGVVELANGDIMVFGSVGNPLDCYAFKFDSLGNYIAHKKWGSTDYGDGNPWPVQISENEFLFAYNHPVSYVFDYITSKPRVGKLYTDDMSVQLFPVLEYPHEFGLVTDFEKTPDGNFIILGFGGPDIQGEIIYAYLVKVNDQGEVIWFKTYTPPELSYDLNAYDLEITSDGGFAFVGNYRPNEEGIFYYKTWVVKTDACGDVVDMGCPTVIEEFNNSTIQTFQIAPNPASGMVSISSHLAIQSITIHDITGKTVMREVMKNQSLQMQLDVSSLAEAMYLIEVHYENGEVVAQKLIID